MKAPTGRHKSDGVYLIAPRWGLEVFPATIPRALPWALTLTHLWCSGKCATAKLAQRACAKLRPLRSFIHVETACIRDRLHDPLVDTGPGRRPGREKGCRPEGNGDSRGSGQALQA